MGRMKPKPRRTKRVALAVRSGVPYLQDTVEEILLYAREREDWQVVIGLEYWPAFSIKHLHGWQGDGIIAWANTRAEANLLAEMEIPAVNISASLKHSPVPRVALDDHAVGRTATEHLIGCGFRRIAHYGTTGRLSSEQRERGFVEAAEAAGVSYSVLRARPELANYRAMAAHEEELKKWLRSLTTPVGVFATHDYRARKLIEVCHRIGLRVPDDVAVIGVNNDPTICEHTDPTLTSVARSGGAVGRAAAELLDELMSVAEGQGRRGKRPGKDGTPSVLASEPIEILIPPEGVVSRVSTDLRPVDDPFLADAMRFLRDHFHEPIDVSEAVQILDISRRTLERKFRRELGTTPHAYLCQLRMERAKQLLRQERRMPMDQIAHECGIQDGRMLRKVFLREVGLNPRRFRHSALSDPGAGADPD